MPLLIVGRQYRDYFFLFSYAFAKLKRKRFLATFKQQLSKQIFDAVFRS